MKKILFLLVASITISGLSSCSTDRYKEQLKQYVITKADGADINYKLISLEVIDTIYIGERIDSIELRMQNSFGINKAMRYTKDNYKEYRDREFMVFNENMNNYEEDVLRGKLKDAFPWYTEIREITETADSLLANWDKVDQYSYEFNRTLVWYSIRMFQFYNRNDENITVGKYLLDEIITNKSLFTERDSLLKLNARENIYKIKVRHKYSILNPLFNKRLELKSLTYFDKDGKLLETEDENSISDLIKQAVQ